MRNKLLGVEKEINLLKSKGIDVMKYMSPVLGFDIVKFDEDLGVPGGTSCSDVVEQKYGKDVVAAIKKLL